METIKKALETKKTKAALLAAFFSALYLSLPIIKPLLPDWVYVILSFLAKLGSASLGGA
ncbi:hypothetical protein [Vibrio diazotrophicus]|uniref:hypothetical protein n=1 Tax=Vibrio diazotrophicus TaxID=685 RepID=UPI0015E11576|nr:hypothetical protein [Vibrio diazotrophicus]